MNIDKVQVVIEGLLVTAVLFVAGTATVVATALILQKLIQ